MDFVARSSYLSAMYDGKSVCPKIETAFAFKPHTNDVNVKTPTNKLLTKTAMNLL